MKKIIPIILVLLFCSTSWAAYDNSSVLVTLGGQGGSANTSGGLYVEPSVTDMVFFDSVNVIKTAGTLTTVKMRLARSAGGDANDHFTVMQLRLSDTTYTVIATLDATAYMTALSVEANTTVSIAIPNWTVAAGDIIAFQVHDGSWTAFIRKVTQTGTQIKRLSGLNKHWVVNDTNTATNAAGTTNEAFTVEYYGTATVTAPLTNNFYVFSQASPTIGDTPIPIPTYKDNGYYIIVEDACVPSTDAQILDINVNGSLTQTGTTVTLFTIRMNYDTATTTMQLINTAGSIVYTQDINNQQGHKFAINIWVDNTTSSVEAIFCNYQSGQGGLGVNDIKHINLSNRVKHVVNASNSFFVRSVTINQPTGTGATVKTLIVCRKPVLLIGDSFTSNYAAATGTVLNGVGAVIGASFTQPRYVINGGVTSGAVYMDSSANASTAIKTRWNSSGQDLCSYRDCIVYLEGAGYNDMATVNSAADAITRPVMVAGSVAKILGEARAALGPNAVAYADTVGGSNDVIMRGQIKRGADGASANVIAAGLNYNKLLRQIAVNLQVPYFEPWTTIPASYYTGIHLTATGYQWLATQAASAYENNRVPVAGNAMSRNK